MTSIHVIHTTDTGHRIVGHKGKCSRLHGHTYKYELWMYGPVRPPGFVADFGDAKDIIDEWDHRILLWNNDPIAVTYVTPGDEKIVGVLRVPFNPTAENMARHLAERLWVDLNLDTVTVQIWETPKCWARVEYDGS